MKTLVTYSSKTGFTEEYARHMAERLHCDIMELKDALSAMDGYDTVIYGGGFYAGRINGLKKALSAYASSGAENMVVFATGAAPNGDPSVEKMFSMNLGGMDLPHFYMRGGLRYGRMKTGDRLMMKVAAKAMNSKSDVDLTGDFEGSLMEYADELIEYVRNI